LATAASRDIAKEKLNNPKPMLGSVRLQSDLFRTAPTAVDHIQCRRFVAAARDESFRRKRIRDDEA
jgi:hypothetical protein